MRLEDTAVDEGSSHTRDWWAHVAIPKGRIHVTAVPQFIGSIHADFRDIDPIMTAVTALHGAPEWTLKFMGIGPPFPPPSP